MLSRREGQARRPGASARRRFVDSRAGTSAVEFALVLPLMLTLWAGMTELSHAVGVWRKVTLLARTVADLASQGDTADPMGAATMSDILSASTAVLRPLAGSSAKITVSAMGVYATNLNNPQVCSSAASGNAVARARGVAADLTVPAEFAAPGDRYLLAEVSLAYAPLIGNAVIKVLGWSGGTIPLKASFVWPVRNGFVHSSNSTPASPEITLPSGSPCS